MGVEFKTYLIPRENDFKPTAQQFNTLIKSWGEEKYIALPESPAFAKLEFNSATWSEEAAKSGAVRWLNRDKCASMSIPCDTNELESVLRHDVRVVWPIARFANTSLIHPLKLGRISEDSDVYLDLEIQISDDYIYRTSECIDPFESTDCKCGQPLEYWIDDEGDTSATIETRPQQIDLFYHGRIRNHCPACKRAFNPKNQKVEVRDVESFEGKMVRGGATSRFAIVIDCGKSVWGLDEIPPVSKAFLACCEKALGTKLYHVSDAY